jgi:hypothetical protein
LKGIFDHFFDCWHNDREKLKRVGRPPAGFESSANAVVASSSAPLVGGNDNNQPAPTVAAAPPKTSWWKTLFGSKTSTTDMVTVTNEAIKVMRLIWCFFYLVFLSSKKVVMELGFDAIAAVQALADSRNDADKVNLFFFFLYYKLMLFLFIRLQCWL